MDLIPLLLKDKSGIEIGGPSYIFNSLYARIGHLDNVIFAMQTIWKTFSDTKYRFYPGKEGQVFERDAVDLATIPTDTYEFLLSSHNLEHIANPLKALQEWIRIVKPGGYIIMVLPNKIHCFDHRRPYTTFETILDKYNRNVGEDNLESLAEILQLHDLSKDVAAGNHQQFTLRSLDNFKNRCLHHHVFNHELVVAMATFTHTTLVHSHIDGLNMWFILEV